jgi:hypothetical protein
MYVTSTIATNNGNVKLFPYLTKHHAMTTFGGWTYSSTHC